VHLSGAACLRGIAKREVAPRVRRPPCPRRLARLAGK
jgi:hypothetical protein